MVAYSVSRGHHGDIGGMHPGSFAGDTVSIFQEGVRLPPIKLYDQGVLNEGVKDLFLANVRVPQFSWGDLQAQVAGCRLGERRIEELFEKYGADAMKAAMDWAMDYSEQLMRAEIEKIPDGTYTFEDYLDNDGIDKDRPVKIHVRVTIEGSDITVDFSGSDAQVKGPANCVLGVVYSATYCAMFNLTDPAIPKNHGCYRPITIIAPEGRVVNARFPAPVVSGNTETSLRIIDTVSGALARVIPEKVIGGGFGHGDGSHRRRLRSAGPASTTPGIWAPTPPPGAPGRPRTASSWPGGRASAAACRRYPWRCSRPGIPSWWRSMRSIPIPAAGQVQGRDVGRDRHAAGRPRV